MRSLHTAATGMMAQELNVQVISNNIANMRTTGYKRQRAEFQDLLYEQVRRVGTQTSDQGNILPAGVELGSGVKTVATPRLMTQGADRADRQGIRRRDPRRRLLPHPDAGWPHGLFTRRLVRTRRAGPPRHRAGQSRAAQYHDPAKLDRRHDQRAGPGVGDADRHDDADRRRPDRTRGVREQSRPAGHRRQLVSRNARHRVRRRPASRIPRITAICSRAISNRPMSRR